MSSTIVPVSPYVCNLCMNACVFDNPDKMAYPKRDNLTQWLCTHTRNRGDSYVLIVRGESTVPRCCPKHRYDRHVEILLNGEPP